MITTLDYHTFIVSKVAPPAPPSVAFYKPVKFITDTRYHFKQSFLHKEVT